MTDKATEYFHGGYLKALGSGKVGGYLVVFGGPKDAQGEYFQPTCDFHLDWYGGTTRPILYHHGMNDEDTIEEIGALYTIVKDEHGIWAEGQLDMTNPRAQQVYSDVRKGKIGWSSGSSPHLAKVDDNGGIYEWAIVEASLTPTPAAGKRTTVQALKFDTSTLAPATPSAVEPDAVKEPAVKGDVTQPKLKLHKGEKPMMLKMDTGLIAALEKAGVSAEQIIEALKELGDGGEEMAEGAMMAEPEAVPEEAPAEPGKGANFSETGDSATIDDGGSKAPTGESQRAEPGSAKAETGSAKMLATALQLAMATMKTEPAKSRAQGGQYENPARKSPRITDMRTPYHDLGAADMAYLYTLRSSVKNARPIPLEYRREMAEKAIKAANSGEITLPADVYGKIAVKAAEFQSTLVANDGSNWVPDLWSSVLWMRVRIDNNIARNLEVFQLPSPTFEYPIESTDPVVYAVGESESDTEMTLTTNVFTRSKLVASKLQFAAKKLGLQVGFSTEINEDSIIPFIPQLRAQATRTFANAIDNVILNSDATTGTTNINYKGANTSAASTSRWLFGGGDGMRHNGLVDNTAAQLNFAGGYPTLLNLRTLRFKLINSTNAYAVDPSQLFYICDAYTYGKLLSIDEINVYMNNGRDATVNTGMVRQLDGSDVYPSAEMALTDSTGFALNDGSGTLGQIVVAAKNAWKIGYMRQVMTDVSYVPWNDNYVLTMTARLAIGKKDTAAAAVGFNINVN